MAKILPDPRISGLLTGTSKGGVVTMPPIFPNVNSSAATPFPLRLRVSSPTDEFPPLEGQLTLSFCPNGTFFNASTYDCQACNVGFWCAAGQPMQPCPDGSFSFYPGAFDSAANCTACDDDNLDCTRKGPPLTVPVSPCPPGPCWAPLGFAVCPNKAQGGGAGGHTHIAAHGTFS